MKYKNLIKKFSIAVVAVMFSFVSLLFTGCTNNNQLNMDYYTLASSTYTLVNDVNAKTTDATEFIGNFETQRQYQKIRVDFSSEWLYSYYINSLTFSVISNTTTNLQFDITLTNLSKGTLSGTLGVKAKTYTLVCEQVAGKKANYNFEISDYFELSAANTCVIFELTNYEIYISDEDINNVTFSLFNLNFAGEHKYI